MSRKCLGAYFGGGVTGYVLWIIWLGSNKCAFSFLFDKDSFTWDKCIFFWTEIIFPGDRNIFWHLLSPPGHLAAALISQFLEYCNHSLLDLAIAPIANLLYPLNFICTVLHFAFYLIYQEMLIFVSRKDLR